MCGSAIIPLQYPESSLCWGDNLCWCEFRIRAAVYLRGTSEDDIYVQAVTGLIVDMLDRARQLPPSAKLFQGSRKVVLFPSQRRT